MCVLCDVHNISTFISHDSCSPASTTVDETSQEAQENILDQVNPTRIIVHLSSWC